jgi:golgin subfamily A protein 1
LNENFYFLESISIDNYIQILKSWIDSKEAIFREKDDIIQRLTQETIDVKNETNELRIKLADLQSLKEKNINKNPYSQKQIDILRSENENLKSDMKFLRKQLNDVETERDDLLIKSTDVTSTDDLQRELAKQKAENERQQIELEKLRRTLLERDAIIEQQDKRLLVDHETQAVQTEEDTSFIQVFAEPDVDTIGKLQAELDDKNRTIKNLQQRYNDLRKTLQREFHASVPKDLNQLGSLKTNSATPSSPTNLPLIHYDASATSQSDVDAAKRASSIRQITAVRKNVTFTTTTASAATVETSPAILPHTSVESKSQRNGHRSSIEGQNTINGTNFKYLKHVLLKFMTSTEDEAIHLIRAVSTLLNFSADEERLLRETLDYKMSWFGKVSRHKPISSNTNF